MQTKQITIGRELQVISGPYFVVNLLDFEPLKTSQSKLIHKSDERASLANDTKNSSFVR
jgi:hypothetical protein